MKNILLMRYRAIAASLFEYVRTRGNVYGKLFSFANSHISSTENGSGSAIAELYQIANGIPESVDDTMMYSLLGTVDQGMPRTQYPDDFMMRILLTFIGGAAGHSNDILFSKGNYLWRSDDAGFGQIQNVDDIVLRSITRSFENAYGHSEDILFGLGKFLCNSRDQSFGRIATAERFIGESLSKSITRGSGITYDIIFGQSVDFIETDARGLGRIATAERFIAKSLDELLYKAGWSSDNIGFSRGFDSTESYDLGLGRIANAEKAISNSVIKLLHKAGWSYDNVDFSKGFDSTGMLYSLGFTRIANAVITSGTSITKFLHNAGLSIDNISFGGGLRLTEIVASLQLGIPSIKYIAGTYEYKLLRTIASLSDLNLLDSLGIMSSKLVGNSAINLEVPDKTQMFFIEKIDNNVSSGITIDSCQSGGISKTEIVSIAGGCFLYTTEERFIKYLNGTLEELLPEDFGDVTEIPDSTHIVVFSDSTEISRIEFPDTLEIISSNCFRDSTITEVIFSANIKKIGYNSFSSAATNAVFDFSKAKQIPTLSPDDGLYGTFGDNSTITIKVPSNLYDDWINKNGWNSMSDRIVAV